MMLSIGNIMMNDDRTTITAQQGPMCDCLDPKQ